MDDERITEAYKDSKGKTIITTGNRIYQNNTNRFCIISRRNRKTEKRPKEESTYTFLRFVS